MIINVTKDSCALIILRISHSFKAQCIYHFKPIITRIQGPIYQARTNTEQASLQTYTRATQHYIKDHGAVMIVTLLKLTEHHESLCPNSCSWKWQKHHEY